MPTTRRHQALLNMVKLGPRLTQRRDLYGPRARGKYAPEGLTGALNCLPALPTTVARMIPIAHQPQGQEKVQSYHMSGWTDKGNYLYNK